MKFLPALQFACALFCALISVHSTTEGSRFLAASGAALNLFVALTHHKRGAP